MSGAITLRDALAADVPAIQAIYAHHVLHGTATFELTPPDVAEMATRRAELVDAGYPFLVAEEHGTVVGYGYAGPYRARIAYCHTVEDSLYLAPHATGRGIGRALLTRLVDLCTARGHRQMIGIVGDSANLPSVRVHAACGFVEVGTLKDVGRKFGRWLDTVVMQRPLGPGATGAPDYEPGARNG